jgi:hypothetical protein
MKLVYTHENLTLVATVANHLRQNDIDVIIKNQYAAGGAGQLAPIETWPEIWVVDDRDCLRANQLVEELNKDSNKPQWQCQNCNEMNDATFDYCWRCQHDSHQ